MKRLDYEVLSADSPGWFCIRSQVKHEPIAAAHLRLIEDLEVFYPRLRLKRPTRCGWSWFTESLFPNYLFIRLVLKSQLARIRHTPGVHGIVRFGDTYPPIPDSSIQALKKNLDTNDIATFETGFQVGQNVVLAKGVFTGIEATVTHILPARERIKILLNFLGRLSEFEVPEDFIIQQGTHPLAV
jgi:transcriptional antiterminator RfaH